MSDQKTTIAEAQKDDSMIIQKEMIAEHYKRLERAPETKEPVVYTFVPGNLTELIRSFGCLPVLPFTGVPQRHWGRGNDAFFE